MKKFIIVETFNGDRVIIRIDAILYIDVKYTFTYKNMSDEEGKLCISRVYHLTDNTEIYEVLEAYDAEYMSAEYMKKLNTGLLRTNNSLKKFIKKLNKI